MASRFVWALARGIHPGREHRTQLLRASSFLWRGRQFYARSVCREEKEHPSWSKTHQPSVDAHQEAVKHAHTLNGVGTSSYKKLYWRYSCVVWQQRRTDKLNVSTTRIPWYMLLLKEPLPSDRVNRACAHLCLNEFCFKCTLFSFACFLRGCGRVS